MLLKVLFVVFPELAHGRRGIFTQEAPYIFYICMCVCVNTWVRLEMNTTMAPLHRLMKATTPQNVIEAL